MSNSPDNPQKSQSLAVKKPIPPEIATIALSSESYWKRVRKSIRVQTGEYIKKDLIYSLIAAAVLGVPTLLAGKATLTAFILGIVGFLVAFVVRGLKHSIETLELFDRAIKGELGESENRFNNLTKDKLKLEIDLRDSKVCLEQTKSALRILGAVTLRFENRDSDALFTKGIRVNFHRHGIVDVRPAADIFAWFGIIRISSDGVDIDRKTFDRMRIAGRDVTPLYLIEFVLGIEDKLVKTFQDIDAVHYLRITVDVSGYHAPLKATLIPYWEQAKEEGCTKQITVIGAETIDQDLSRID